MQYTIKKRVISLISLLLLVFLLCGCSVGEGYNPSELSKMIARQTDFSKMKDLSGTSLSSYFVFSDTDVKRFSVAVSATGESADTIACFEVVDKQQQDTVVSGISQYLTKLSTSFKATMENEYSKVQSRILVKLDNTVVLVVCNEYESVKSFLYELGAKEIF